MNKIFISFATAAFLALAVSCGGSADAEVVEKPADVVKTAAPKAVNNTSRPAANTNAAPAADADQPKTTLSWDKEEHDFGNIDEGDRVKTAFSFTNTGDEPLIISSAKGSCGCTVPKWPREPIPPGGKGQIDVEFNSKNKPGRQTKTVTIMANTDPNPIRLKIMAQVAKDPNKEDPKKK